MLFEIKNGDVFDFEADALVFPASKKPVNGGNFDGRVFANTDGAKLLEARQEIGEIQSGNAEITESFGLKGYDYLIHTVMPNYNSAYYDPVERLKRCYINSLAVAEENNIKSVVFPVLGGGCAGFPSHNAKNLAIKILSEYQKANSESCIETVILVLYDRRQEYHKFVTHNRCMRILSELDVPDMYFSEGSSMNRRMDCVSDKLINKIKSETDRLYLEYRKEKADFCEKNKEKESPEDIYQDFDDELYRNLFKKYQKVKDEDFAEILGFGGGSEVSALRNLKTRKGSPYKSAYGFLRTKSNVIFLGECLELNLNDFCRLLWSRGYEFPKDREDYKLINELIDKEKENIEYPEPEMDL